MITRRGIVLAGGSGTRLHPITLATSKQLLPVYDKPMVYYPIATLMQAGIREIMIITTPQDRSAFERLLGDGSQWGIRLEYATQDKPNGIAMALTISRDFLDGSPSALILGDNIYTGPPEFSQVLRHASSLKDGATVFGRRVPDLHRYGVATFGQEGRVIEIEEKPARPKSDVAVTGLYFYDSRAPDFAARLKPSPRGELEITDLNRCYLAEDNLHLSILGDGYNWFDAGTYDSLLDASLYIQEIQHSGARVACLDQIAKDNGWIAGG